MKSEMIANGLRQASIEHIKDSRLSYRRLESILCMSWRAVMALMTRETWTVDEGMRVADRLGIPFHFSIDSHANRQETLSGYKAERENPNVRKKAATQSFRTRRGDEIGEDCMCASKF